MYKAKKGGSATSKDGRTYRFTAGKLVEGAEEGSLDHCPSVEWVEESNGGLPEDFPAKELLEEAGYDSIEKISEATAKDLTEIKGIGKATAEDIFEAI